MKTVYCKAWNRAKNKPQGILQESEARRLHEKGEPYTIICYKDDGKLYRIVEMFFGDYYCAVQYFDALERNHYREAFELHNGRLLMKNSMDRAYDSEGKKLIAAEDILYEDDGLCKVVKYHAPLKKTTTACGKVNPEALSRDLPPFGNYQSLFNEARG